MSQVTLQLNARAAPNRAGKEPIPVRRATIRPPAQMKALLTSSIFVKRILTGGQKRHVLVDDRLALAPPPPYRDLPHCSAYDDVGCRLWVLPAFLPLDLGPFRTQHGYLSLGKEWVSKIHVNTYAHIDIVFLTCIREQFFPLSCRILPTYLIIFPFFRRNLLLHSKRGCE